MHKREHFLQVHLKYRQKHVQQLPVARATYDGMTRTLGHARRGLTRPKWGPTAREVLSAQASGYVPRCWPEKSSPKKTWLSQSSKAVPKLSQSSPSQFSQKLSQKLSLKLSQSKPRKLSQKLSQLGARTAAQKAWSSTIRARRRTAVGRCLLPALLFLPAVPRLECRLPRSSLVPGKMKHCFRGSMDAIPAS